MGNKIKPWHSRKPKRHGPEQPNKRPHQRPAGKNFHGRNNERNQDDRYGQWTSYDRTDEEE